MKINEISEEEKADILNYRKSSNIYYSKIDQILEEVENGDMNNAEVGQFVIDFFRFVRYGEIPKIKDRGFRIMFNEWREAFERDTEKYIIKVYNSRQNGKQHKGKKQLEDAEVEG